MSIRIAQNLINLGYKQNDIFTLIARNNARVSPLMYGIFLMGGVLNPLDVSMREGMIHVLILAYA